jgi:hypothetical protein
LSCILSANPGDQESLSGQVTFELRNKGVAQEENRELKFPEVRSEHLRGGDEEL